MTTVQQHYDHHLGPIYDWMIGDFAAAMERQREQFQRIGLATGNGRTAVDLGAGSGLQSLPLAESGYQVLALDACQTLLNTLASRAQSAGLTSLRTACDDLIHFRRHLSGQAEVIVCMGDTLAHLPSRTVVAGLLREVAEALAPGGLFVATLRDCTSHELVGTQRFIPVRSDSDRILTCFLEYFPDHIRVHDLVHQRSGGEWHLAVSVYRKLRLSGDWLLQELRSHGLVCTMETSESGMLQITARKAT
jgi:SAM-dependent methyltransferase